MKRILSLFLCLCLLLTLAGCGKAENKVEETSPAKEASAASEEAPAAQPEKPAEESEVKPEEPDDTPKLPDRSAQIELIAANVDSWLNTDDLYADSTLYVVSDLDENGRLEIISSIMQGSGFFTELSIFEVSEDGTALEAVSVPFAADHSLPDFYYTPFVRCYRGDDGNYFMIDDVIRVGAAETYYVQDWMRLQDGELTCGDVAWCMALDNGLEGEEDFYTDYFYYPGGTEDAEYTHEEYLGAADVYFGGYDKKVATFFWCSVPADTAKDPKALYELLETSADGFGFDGDMQYFDTLVDDPAARYYEGDGQAYYTVEDLLGEWYLYSIETEYDVRYAFDGGVDSTVTFLKGPSLLGQVFFSYNDPTDARGAYLLTEMPYDLGDGYEVPAEGDDWYVVFGTDDGLNRFDAGIDPTDGSLKLTWFWWSEEDPGTDPVITRMRYVRAMG